MLPSALGFMDFGQKARMPVSVFIGGLLQAAPEETE